LNTLQASRESASPAPSVDYQQLSAALLAQLSGQQSWPAAPDAATSHGSAARPGRTIESLAAEFLAGLEGIVLAEELSREQADHIGRRLRAVIAHAGWQTAADVDATSCQGGLARIAAKGGKLGHATMAVKTRGDYLRAAKRFAAWLAAERALPRDPLAGLKVAKPRDHQRRLVRRAASDAEFAAIVAAAMRGAAIETIGGADRAHMYLVAAYTGYRRTEIGSLMRDSFVFTEAGSARVAGAARVIVEAAVSKNGQRAIQVLPAPVAVLVEAWLARRDPDALLWPVSARRGLDRLGGKDRKTWKMVRKDCEAAGVRYRDRSGRQIDFHALRKTYISNLALAGNSPRVVQEMARHSSIDLTMNVYAEVRNAPVEAAAATLPPPPDLRPAAEWRQGELF
jgi:integrase